MLHVNEGVGQSFLGLLPGALKQDSSVCQLSQVLGGSMKNDFAQHLHTHLLLGDSARDLIAALIPTDVTRDPVPFPNSQNRG
jgi:hypothetical protein